MPTLARTLAGFVTVVASALAWSCSGGASKPETPRISADVHAEWEHRLSRALDEIASEGTEHAWAGDYRCFSDGDFRWLEGGGVITGSLAWCIVGDGQSKCLLISPTGRCVAASPDPRGGENQNFGSVVEENGVLHITFERPNDPYSRYGFHTEYTIHGTGSDRYLREVLLPGEPWGRIFEREKPSAQTIVRGER